MARSPATREVLTVIAAAAAGWLALVAVVYRLVPLTDPGEPRRTIRTAPAHGRVGLAGWEGAPRVYEELDRRARALSPEERTRVARTILEEAARAELAPLLVLAVIQVESAFNPRAVSPVGAVGLMQLMVPTFRELTPKHAAADPFDPVVNVRAGVRYLAQQVVAFSSVELALVAYNAGPARLRRLLGSGGVPSRLLGYPRDVLRRVVQLAPPPSDIPGQPGVAAAFAAAHGKPARKVVLARSGAASRGTIAAAALAGGARDRARASVARPEPLAAAPLLAGPRFTLAEPRGAGWPRDACIRLEVGLPMSRARDRTSTPPACNTVA